MSENWFERAEHGLQRATGHLHRHPDTISESETQAPPPAGAIVSLKQILEEGTALLESGKSNIDTFLTTHAPQLATLANLIESNPIFASVEGALHVPPEILSGIAKALDALAAAYPKPEAPVEAEPQAA